MANKFTTKVTNEGLNLLQLASQQDKKVEFINVIASSTAYSENQLISETYDDINSRASKNQTGTINNLTIDKNITKMELVFDGHDIKSDYTLNSIFLIAKLKDSQDLKLFAIIKANQPQYMNSYDGSGSTNLQINLGVKFSNNDKVTLQIDTAAIATLGDLSNLRNETQAKLDKETTRATEKEKNLALDIETEKNRAIKAENTLQTNIDTIDSRAQSEEKKLSNKLDTETTRAIQSEQELQGKVETETKNVADLKKIVDDKINEITDLMTTLNQTNTATLGELNSAKTALKETTKIFDTVEEMKNADLVSGMTIETLGYYKISDGGGAKYVVTDVMPDTFFEKSKSGLYLKLIDNDLLLNRRGVKNDGTEDISDIFQNAITECLKSKTNSTVRLLDGYYLVGKTIEFPIRSLNLEGVGGTAVLKSSENTSTLFHLNGDPSFDETKWKNNRRFIRNIRFSSMNKNVIEGSIGTLIGDANNEVAAQGGACQFYFENCSWQNFDAGIVVGSNAYLFDLNKCSSYNLNTMFKSWSPWIRNSGEKIGISDSIFTSCKDTVINLTSQLDLRFKTTSFDALEGGSVLKANIGRTSHGSQILIFDNCHFEVGKMTQSTFQIASSSNPMNFKVINSRFWLDNATVDNLIDNRNVESSVVFENNEIGSSTKNSVKYIGENVTISKLSMGSRGDMKPLIFSNSILTGFSNRFFDSKMRYELNNSIKQNMSWINIQRDNSSWKTDSQRLGSQNVSLSLNAEVPDKSISKSIEISISNVKGYYNIDFMVPQNETGILEYGFFAKPINNFDNNIKILLIPIMWNDYDPKSFVSPTSRTVTFEANQWNKFEFNTAPYRADCNSMIGFRLQIDSSKVVDDATFNVLLSSPYIRMI